MTLENIVNKIIGEANETVKVIEERTEGELEKMRRTLEREEKELNDLAVKDAKTEAEKVIMRRVSSARLEGRKRILGIKEMILNETFIEARDKLKTLPDDKYLELLKGFVLEYASTGNEIISLSPFDLKRLKNKLEAWVKGVNGELKEKGLSGNMKVSDATRDIVGGLVLSEGKTEMNLDFDIILQEMRFLLEGGLTEILFGTEKS